MTKPKIVAHCVVRNEERWVWYALMSAIDHVDEILVWDTGSNDRTVEIIKTITNSKIKFKQLEITSDETALSGVRQQMLKASTGFDWLMILDGDEVWPTSSLTAIGQSLSEKGEKYESVVTPTLNCVGDVFHIMPPETGRYHLAGRVGHLNTRFINLKIPGLHVHNDPGKLQGYLDATNTEIHHRDADKILFLNSPYLHMTHMTRSARRKNETDVFWRAPKKKYELGQTLPKDFSYPGSFYFPRPSAVTSPWEQRPLNYTFTASLLAPAKWLKRKFIWT